MTKTAPRTAPRPLAALALSLCGALAPALALAAPASADATGALAAPAGAVADGADALDAKDSPPGNWTLGEREQWQKLEKELTQYSSLMNTSCGTSIAVVFDHETFRGKLMEAGKTGPNATLFWTHVTQGLGAVRELCLSGDPGKGAVKSKITKITLQHAGGSRAHKINAGRLSMVVDPAEAPRQWHTALQEFLKKSL
jgi:hypothetical protein